MPQCIYCLEIKPTGDFNREHVLQAAFGTFGGASLTLIETVCAACNSALGQELDEPFARTTHEGLERFRKGIKRPEDIQHFSYREVEKRANASGPLRGALLEDVYDAERGEWCAALRTQVGYPISDSVGYAFFSERDIRSGKWKRTPPRSSEEPLSIFAVTEDEGNQLVGTLRAAGLSNPLIELEVPLSLGMMLVSELMLVGDLTRRTVGKIAFNYLAKQFGPEVALRTEFDSLRRFVRYGENPATKLVTTSFKKLLQVSELAHTVLILPSGDGLYLFCEVQLFQGMVYRVRYSDLPVEGASGMAAGHIFDIVTKSARPLVDVARIARRSQGS